MLDFSSFFFVLLIAGHFLHFSCFSIQSLIAWSMSSPSVMSQSMAAFLASFQRSGLTRRDVTISFLSLNGN